MCFSMYWKARELSKLATKSKLQPKDWLIDSPKTFHCLYNESNADFRVLVVKTPSPTAEQNKQAIKNMLKQIKDMTSHRNISKKSTTAFYK